jgi:glycosyltransferase involved in cell wall biosynthesis
VLVDAGLAPGERVHCLPLISPVACATVEASRAARAVVRARLGLAPGVRLVMGVEPDSPAHATDRWDRALLGTRRRDVVVARIRPAGARADCFQVRLVSGLWLNEPVRLPELLAAADVFIAAGHDLEAYTPAVAAVACGIPVVAVTTDSVAELVMSGGRGCVVPARAAQITAAVVAQLDGGLPARRTPATATDQSHRLAEFARALLAVYRHVLCTSVVGAA